jgi:EAL domain-containing protein (putative c-di-GMP-specific phosphodiesterase class I)
MSKFKTSDRKRIVIEIGETGFGDINKEFIKNIIWLKAQGFRLALDDYDLLKMQGKSDISRKLLSVIGQYCEKIKLDYKTTAKILKDPTLQRLIIKHYMQYNHSITAE